MTSALVEDGFAVLEISPDLVSEWERLAVATETAPFSRPGWCLAWAEAFGRRLRLAVVRREGELVAGLPVAVDRHRVATCADWQVPFVATLAWADRDRGVLFEGIAARFRRVSIDFVLAGSATEEAAASSLRDRPSRRIVRMRSPYLDTTGSFEDYRRGLDGKKLRELRRRRRRLSEDVGPVDYMVVDGSGEWERALDEGLTIEASGWKGRTGTAVRSDAATERFYRRITAWAAEAKLLQIGLLRAAGRPVAFDLALDDGRSTWLLKTGFDDRFGRYAPGSQLRFEAIRAAFERGLVSYEFTGDAEPWKDEWTRSCHDIVLLDAFPAGVWGRVGLHYTRAARTLRVGGRHVLSWLR